MSEPQWSTNGLPMGEQGAIGPSESCMCVVIIDLQILPLAYSCIHINIGEDMLWYIYSNLFPSVCVCVCLYRQCAHGERTAHKKVLSPLSPFTFTRIHTQQPLQQF